MDQTFINWLLGGFGALTGFLLSAVWQAVKDLQAADKELATIDPRLVHWGHAMKAVEQPNGLPPKMVEDKDSPLVPIGVQYSRLVVPLLQVVKRQSAAIEALTARLDKLEGKV